MSQLGEKTLQPPVIRAGVARVCITPPVGTWQGGYGARTSTAVGVHDDLFARALVLQAQGGAPPIAIVALDIVGLTPEITGEARRLAHEVTGIPAAAIALCASHTHGGPILRSFLGLEGPQPDVEYTNILPKYLAGVIAAAARELRPVTLSAASESAGFGVNRRLPSPQGIAMRPNPQGPIDRDVRVLRVDLHDQDSPNSTATRPPLAVLFSFACHATSLGAQNLLFTADYPGVAAAHLERIYGDGTTALFLQGCAGDVRPALVSPQGGFRSATWPELAGLGRQLGAAAVLAAERAIGPDPGTSGNSSAESGTVRAAGTTITLPFAPPPAAALLRNLLDASQWPDGRIVIETERRWALNTLDLIERGAIPEGVAAEIQVFRLGAFWLVTLPGEVFIEIGWSVRDAVARAASVPPDRVLVTAYANGSVGYVPTAAAMTEGGYETVAYRHQARPCGYASETGDLLTRTAAGLAAAIR